MNRSLTAACESRLPASNAQRISPRTLASTEMPSEEGQDCSCERTAEKCFQWVEENWLHASNATPRTCESESRSYSVCKRNHMMRNYLTVQIDTIFHELCCHVFNGVAAHNETLGQIT